MNELGEEFRSLVYAAAGRAEVREAVSGVYADLRRAIALCGPKCDASGRCCRFEEFGHRLFVSTLELAAFTYDLLLGPTAAGNADPAQTLAQWDGCGCPFQVAKLCGVHAFRPFGCRVFFCDPTSTLWQNEQYEQFHARFKRLHETLEVPYYYLEWRQALRALFGEG